MHSKVAVQVDNIILASPCKIKSPCSQDKMKIDHMEMIDESKGSEHLLQIVTILQQVSRHWSASRASKPFA